MLTASTKTVTELLNEVANGDEHAWPGLVRLLYADLRRVAASRLRKERGGQTLQPTDLVHEAYLRLSGYRKKSWVNRTHFLASAATMMRRILVDQARRRRRRHEFDSAPALNSDAIGLDGMAVDMLDLDRALVELERTDVRLTRIVELRYFGGLTVEETAEVLEISVKTVKRDWAIARAFLHGLMAPR